MSARVVVVVTPGCHLCETAITVVDEVCAEAGVSWKQQQLADLDAARQNEWRNYVPVVLIDDSVHDIFRVDRQRLAEALAD
jgi:hypothetical protein